MNSLKLGFDDLNLPCKTMAMYLLNKVVARKLENGIIVKGKIVETECYLGGDDQASHSYNGKVTPRNEPMFMPPGTAYVYMTFGMYYCLNISSVEPGAAVLIRALEPLVGNEEMRKLRSVKRQQNSKRLKDTELCNGPSKFCLSFNITKENANKVDLCTSDSIWLEDNDENADEELNIVTTSRIGIASAGVEWASKPLRFYILGNAYVSKRDRTAEKELV